MRIRCGGHAASEFRRPFATRPWIGRKRLSMENYCGWISSTERLTLEPSRVKMANALTDGEFETPPIQFQKNTI